MRERVRMAVFWVLVAALAIGGSLLLFTGWWIPDVKSPLRYVGLSWLLLCVSTAFIGRVPYLQLALAWIWFGTSSWEWWLFTDEKAFDWWLFQNVFPVIAVACSQVHFILGRVRR